MKPQKEITIINRKTGKVSSVTAAALRILDKSPKRKDYDILPNTPPAAGSASDDDTDSRSRGRSGRGRGKSDAKPETATQPESVLPEPEIKEASVTSTEDQDGR